MTLVRLCCRGSGALQKLQPLAFRPFDLRVAETTVSADGSFERRRSGEMLDQFAVCTLEVTKQVQKHLEGK
jgi:hypothetical protein